MSAAAKLLPLMLAAVVAAAPVRANDIRTGRVYFAPGATRAVIAGSLEGREIVDYLLGAHAGQTLSVTMDSDNTAAYVNVIPPDAENVAVYAGHIGREANRYEGTLDLDGDWKLRVYLFRAAARRGETADYRLQVEVTGEPARGPLDGDRGRGDLRDPPGRDLRALTARLRKAAGAASAGLPMPRAASAAAAAARPRSSCCPCAWLAAIRGRDAAPVTAAMAGRRCHRGRPRGYPLVLPRSLGHLLRAGARGPGNGAVAGGRTAARSGDGCSCPGLRRHSRLSSSSRHSLGAAGPRSGEAQRQPISCERASHQPLRVR